MGNASQPAEAEGVVAWAPSTALEKLNAGFNNAPCVLTDGPAEFNNVPLVTLAALSAVTAERDGLAAARMAYASEFAPDENGDPDVGNVHANIRALKAERDRLQQFESAYNEWHDKTEWVQKTAEAHELGKHRADVLKDRVDQLRAEVERLRAGGNRTAARETMRRILPDVPGDLLDHALFAAHSAAMAAKEA